MFITVLWVIELKERLFFLSIPLPPPFVKFLSVSDYLFFPYKKNTSWTMKILFDHQLFSLEIMGGMSKYYYQLIQWLEKEWHTVVIPVRWTHNYFLQKYFDSKKISYRSWLWKRRFKGRQNLVYRCNKFLWRRNKDRLLQWVDIVHCTLFDPYMIHDLKKRRIPFVFTVYDLNHKTQKLKETRRDRRMCDYAEYGIAQLAQHASRIVCVSGQTKRDLLHYYPTVDPLLIQVIYHSIDIHAYDDYNFSPLVQTSPHHIPYILFIGKRKAPYKNFKPFLTAIAPLLSSQLHLLCLWHEPFDISELQLIKDLHIQEYLVDLSWDEQEKFRLLRHTVCFVYPSLAEWFGIPILEAWLWWAPVLCSAISVFMEIAQGAALYFDPRSIENMRELIWSVVSSTDIQDNLKAVGSQRVLQFDISIELKKTMELYHNICILS